METKKFAAAKGSFSMKFPNGWQISVSFARGNYCDNRDMKLEDERAANIITANLAEVMFTNPSGDTHEPKGWCSPEMVLGLMVECAIKARV